MGAQITELILVKGGIIFIFILGAALNLSGPSLAICCQKIRKVWVESQSPVSE